KLCSVVLNCIRRFYIDCFGADLLQSLVSQTQIDDAVIASRVLGHGIFIFSYWNYYDSIVEWAQRQHIIAVVVAPVWPQHRWLGNLLSASTHIWRLPADPSFFRPSSHFTWDIVVIFVAFRVKHVLSPIITELKSLDDCQRLIKPCCIPKRLTVFR